MKHRILQILLVEDNAIDMLLIKDALQNWTIENVVNVAENGQDALDFVFRKGDFIEAQRPDLIILDLNLPMKNGKEFLAEIKKDSSLRDILVVVVTTSDSDSDKKICYDLGVQRYITKLMDYEAYLEAINSIQELIPELDYTLQRRSKKM